LEEVKIISSMRKQNQQIWDYIAVLKLFDGVNRISHIDGNLKIQKLTFLSELEGFKNDVAVMHFRFFKYHFGPYSKELANSVKFLMQQGFITSSRRLTNRGKFLIEYITDVVNQSPSATKAFEIISNISNRFGRRSGPKLTDLVYSLKVPVYEYEGQEKKIRDIGTFTDILVPTQTEGLQDILPLSDDMLDDIEQELNIPPDILDSKHASYQKAIDKAASRVKTALLSYPIIA